mmetsp:Transcript_21378/g.46783  ORF Transcript_21378/g.46783 Transcript_21378/m.46783 type:complete len:132 (+) Transcript_21378:698-1093(+)
MHMDAAIRTPPRRYLDTCMTYIHDAWCNQPPRSYRLDCMDLHAEHLMHRPPEHSLRLQGKTGMCLAVCHILSRANALHQNVPWLRASSVNRSRRAASTHAAVPVARGLTTPVRSSYTTRSSSCLSASTSCC